MTSRWHLLIAATAAAALSTGEADAAKRSSSFTKVSDKACGLIEENKETGDRSRACPGAGPYGLEWGSGDLRDDLTVIRGASRTELQIPSIVARGPFDSIGETVEWRGPRGRAPDVLIVRVHVARPDGSDDSGRLAVARLSKSPCLVAVVAPMKGQSEKARRIADGPPGKCLKP